MRVSLVITLLAVVASAMTSRPLRVGNRLPVGRAGFTVVGTPPTKAPPPEEPPSLEATQQLVANNPGMHRLNQMVMTQVSTGLQNEVVCTFCLLQVLSLAYQLGNSTVRREVEVALSSPQPRQLADALLWAASAEDQTLAGTLLGYYQKDHQPTCDKLQFQLRRPLLREKLPDSDRCKRLDEFVSDIGRPVDFTQPTTTDRINGEVSRATGGRIERLFPPLPADTRLVFVSALVFGDRWLSQMIPERGVFHGANRDVHTELLRLRKSLAVLKGDDDGVVGVALPYEHLGVRMFLFKTTDRTDIRHRLSQQHYERLAATRLFTYTHVTIPSFDITSKKSSYVDLISNMGMRTMFDGGMGADDQLKVGMLEHKAVMKTDKDGTQAAGAAGIALVPLSAKPQPFQARFDQPFVCSLVHAELGVPIFTAYVADPLLN